MTIVGITKERILATKPDLFLYHDYREFLKDWFQYSKSIDPDFSQRSFAKRSNISPSFLTMVLSGQTPLTNNALSLIEPHLGLSQNETHFLTLLMQLIDAKSLEDQREAFKRLSRLGMYRGKHPEMISGHYYFSNWFNVAIRELSQVKDFKLDADWIYKKLNRSVAIGKIRDALHFLCSNKFIDVDENGNVKKDVRPIFMEGPLYRLALCEFYNQVLHKAIDAVYTVELPHRKYASNTIALSHENFFKVKDIIDHAMDQIDKIVKAESAAEHVYHVSMVAFPFTRQDVSK